MIVLWRISFQQPLSLSNFISHFIHPNIIRILVPINLKATRQPAVAPMMTLISTTRTCASHKTCKAQNKRKTLFRLRKLNKNCFELLFFSPIRFMILSIFSLCFSGGKIYFVAIVDSWEYSWNASDFDRAGSTNFRFNFNLSLNSDFRTETFKYCLI